MTIMVTNCVMNSTSNSSNSVRDFSISDSVIDTSWIEKSFSVAIQIMGLTFVVSSMAMFVKFQTLHKIQNVFQMNLLVSSMILLVVDWPFLQLGVRECEVYSLVLLVFGSASTLTTTSVAMERYRKMSRLMTDSQSRKQYTACVMAVWGVSLLSVSTLLQTKLQTVFDWSTTVTANPPIHHLPANNNLCFFSDGALYRHSWHSLTFMVLSVVLPTCVMIFCYTKIYCSLRVARINRWLNQVASHCSQNSTVISTSSRKANIIECSSKLRHQNTFPSQPPATKERGILLQGLFSVALVAVCWLPITVSWFVLSFTGYKSKYSHYILCLILLTKISAGLNVCYYICFNVKFRKAYLKLFFECCQKSSSMNTITDFVTSQINSLATTREIQTQKQGQNFNILPTVIEMDHKPNRIKPNNQVCPYPVEP